MNPDDVTPVGDDFAAWAAGYDEALAAGRPPDAPPPLAADPAVARRQEHFIECLRRLHDDRRARHDLPLDATLGSTGEDAALVPPAVDVGRFRLVRVLGGGAFGVVYLAEDPRLGRLVALKVPRPGALLAHDSGNRFYRETRAAARLSHPHILPVYESGEAGAVGYYATAYCAGGSLAAWLARGEPLPPRAAAALVAALARAVAHAHEQGVLHRDLKPGNVLLEPLGADEPGLWEGFRFRPRIGDFGLAKLLDAPADDEVPPGPPPRTAASHASTQALLGTPAYMAPEQAQLRRKDIGPATDVYGLGAILYECLAGRPPFAGADARETLHRVTHEEPASPRQLCPDVPRDLEAICLQCLRKRPADRYGGAAALADDLQRFLDGQPTRARPEGVVSRAARWGGRHRAAVVLLAVVGLGLPALAGGAWWYLQRLRHFDDALSAAAEREQAAAAAAEREREWGLRRQAYPTGIRLAASHLGEGKRQEALDVLAEYAPPLGTADPRGFEWHYLWGEATKLRRLRGANTCVDAVVFTPDGQTCISGGEVAFERWEVGGGRLLSRTAAGSDGNPAGPWPTPDGSRLLVVDPGEPATLSLWDTAEQRPLLRRRFPRREAHEAAVSPDGKTVAVSGSRWSSGGTTLSAIVRLWDIPGDRERVLWERSGPGKNATATALCFAPGGRTLAVAAGNSATRVEMVDVPSGKTVATLHWDSHVIVGLAYSPDGTALATSETHGTVMIWDVATGKAKTSFKLDQPVRALAFAPDGRTLAVGTWAYVLPDTKNWSVTLWDVATGTRLPSKVSSIWGVLTLAYSPDGHTLAVGGHDSNVLLWRPHTGMVSLPGHAPREAWAVAFTPDGKTLVSGGDDHAVRLWDTAIGKERAVFRGHQSLVTSVAVSPDGRRIASGSFDKTVTVWDAGTGKPLWRGEHEAVVRNVAVSPDGRLVAGSDRAGTVRVWDAATGRPHARLTHDTPVVQGLAFAGPNLLIARDGGRARLWDVDAGRTLRVFRDESTIWSLAVSPDGTTLATGNHAAEVRLWDIDTGRLLRVLRGHAANSPYNGSRHSLRAVAFAPDGKTLASGGEDGTVRLWHVETGQELLCFKDQPAHVNGLAFSPDGERLAAALHDGSVRVWAAGPRTPGIANP